jgi:hypothetical protein
MLPDLRGGRGYSGVAGVQQQPVRAGRAVRCRGGRGTRRWGHAARSVAEACDCSERRPSQPEGRPHGPILG